MADQVLVTAWVIQWKRNQNGEAVIDNQPEQKVGVYPASDSDDRIRQRILTQWIAAKPASDQQALLQNFAEGLITLEMNSPSAIKTPEILPDLADKPNEMLDQLKKLADAADRFVKKQGV